MNLQLIHREFFVLVSGYARMMLLRIEDRYCYGLKISQMKRKLTKRLWRTRTSENYQAARQSVMQSPARPTSKHASTLGLSDWTKNGKTISRWSYHCHLLIFTYSIQETVYNVEDISVTPYIYIYIYNPTNRTLYIEYFISKFNVWV